MREVIEARRLELHLDELVTARYMRWLGNARQGDLGRSIEGREVGSLIWARDQVTLRMMTLAILLARWSSPSGLVSGASSGSGDVSTRPGS